MTEDCPVGSEGYQPEHGGRAVGHSLIAMRSWRASPGPTVARPKLLAFRASPTSPLAPHRDPRITNTAWSTGTRHSSDSQYPHHTASQFHPPRTRPCRSRQQTIPCSHNSDSAHCRRTPGNYSLPCPAVSPHRYLVLPQGAVDLSCLEFLYRFGHFGSPGAPHLM